MLLFRKKMVKNEAGSKYCLKKKKTRIRIRKSKIKVRGNKTQRKRKKKATDMNTGGRGGGDLKEDRVCERVAGGGWG